MKKQKYVKWSRKRFNVTLPGVCMCYVDTCISLSSTRGFDNCKIDKRLNTHRLCVNS